MNQVLNNSLFLLLGVPIGFLLGWTLKTMHYAKQTRDVALRMQRKLDEHGWTAKDTILGALVIVTGVAAIWTGMVNSQLSASKTCTEKTISQLTSALSDRTSLSTDLSIADSSQNAAFRDLMVAVLSQPQPKPDRMRVIFQDYVDKLNTYLDLQARQRQAQTDHPLPKEIDYKKCLEG